MILSLDSCDAEKLSLQQIFLHPKKKKVSFFNFKDFLVGSKTFQHTFLNLFMCMYVILSIYLHIYLSV